MKFKKEELAAYRSIQLNMKSAIERIVDIHNTKLKEYGDIVEPLESLNPENEITGLLQDWTTNRQSARTMDDIFNKLPYTDDKREFTYFRMEDFYNFCKRNHWEIDKIKTGNLLKRLEDIFVEEERIRVKNQQPRLIKIKAMKKIDASISKVK